MTPKPLRLSPRQREILGQLAQGDSPTAIAEALGISRKTVYIHLQGARDRNDRTTEQLIARYRKEETP